MSMIRTFLNYRFTLINKKVFYNRIGSKIFAMREFQAWGDFCHRC